MLNNFTRVCFSFDLSYFNHLAFLPLIYEIYYWQRIIDFFVVEYSFEMLINKEQCEWEIINIKVQKAWHVTDSCYNHICIAYITSE